MEYRYSGEEIVSGTITADMTGNQRGWFHLQPGNLDQWFELQAAPRHLGGRQWYFLCPMKDRIASVLWKPPGANRFCSRQTWGRQVAYGSQFESPHDRALNAAQDIRYRLGWKDYTSIDDCMPPKPKWMRWRTYERIIQRYEANEAICNQYLLGLLARLMH